MFGNDVKFGIRSHTVTEKGFQLTTFEMGSEIFVLQLFTYDHKLIFACFVTYLQFCQVTTQLLHNNALKTGKHCPNSTKKIQKKIALLLYKIAIVPQRPTRVIEIPRCAVSFFMIRFITISGK